MQDTGTFRRASISTADFPEGQRLQMWREIYGRGITNVDIDPIGDAPFRASVTFDLLPNVSIAGGTRSPAHYSVTHDQASRFKDILVISTLRSGSASATQFGKELISGVGSASVIAPQAPVTSTMLTEGSFVTLALSLPALAKLAPHYTKAFGRSIRHDNQALRLLTQYVGIVQGGEPLTDAATAKSVSDHLMDLTALALGTLGDHAELARLRGAAAARLTVIKSDILRALSNNELSTELIAALHGISPRYVRKLFEQDGSSFSDFVLTQRLSRAHDMLTDRRCGHLTIIQISHENGFGDLSYFNRTFRRKFGGTPTDVREAARRRQQD